MRMIDPDAAPRPLRILVADDDPNARQRLKRILCRGTLPVATTLVASLKEAMAPEQPDFDAILLEYTLTGREGFDALDPLRRRYPHAAILILAARGDEGLAKTAIQRGAADYLPKRGLREVELWRALIQAVDQAQLAAWHAEQRAALMNFAEVLVHDMRAPIRSTAFLSDQIEEDISAGDLGAARDTLAMLRKSTSNMQDLVRSLAAHLQPEGAPNIAPVAAQDLVETACLALCSDIEARNARIETQIDPVDITCAGPEIAQLIQNLIANALRFHGEGAPNISIRLQDLGDEIELAVSDRGPGVPEELRAVIFEPFRRGPSAKGLPGSGLGLATCKKIAERHGGRIWCDAAPGGGALFRLRMPRNGEELVANSRPGNSPGPVAQLAAQAGLAAHAQGRRRMG